MPYAIKGSSLRAINSESDLLDGEAYSEHFPYVWPPEATDSEKVSAFKVEVQSALDFSDRVALRAYKAGVPFGDLWTQYDLDLRALMSVTEWSEDLALPQQPSTYPS